MVDLGRRARGRSGSMAVVLFVAFALVTAACKSPDAAQADSERSGDGDQWAVDGGPR